MTMCLMEKKLIKAAIVVAIITTMILVLSALTGCGLPRKGNELGLMSAKLTTEVLRQNLEYAQDVRAANDAFIDAKREMATQRFKEVLAASSTPFPTDEGDVPVISVEFASKQIDDYDAAVAKMMIERDKNRDVFEAIAGMIDDAIETQEDWVRYLLETADWNERQKTMFNNLLETAFTE